MSKEPDKLKNTYLLVLAANALYIVIFYLIMKHFY